MYVCNITLILIFIHILIFSGIYVTIYQNHILLVNKAINKSMHRNVETRYAEVREYLRMQHPIVLL